MQVEEGNRAVKAPQPEHRTASVESKPKHGGHRPGAGRKPNLAKRLLGGANRATAADVLAKIDVEAVVNDLLKNGSRQLKWQVITVLWDRVYGKPKQDVSVTGGIIHAHTRDPFLASLPNAAGRLQGDVRRCVPAAQRTNRSSPCRCSSAYLVARVTPKMILTRIMSEHKEAVQFALWGSAILSCATRFPQWGIDRILAQTLIAYLPDRR